MKNENGIITVISRIFHSNFNYEIVRRNENERSRLIKKINVRIISK